MSRLLAGDRSGFEGEVFRLPRAPRLTYPPERDRVPLLVGTWSPRLTAFAAEHAAELKIGGSANPAMVRVARERLGAAEVGIVVGAVTVVDRDDGKAREHARRQVAMYLAVVAGLDPSAGVPPELIAAVAAELAADDVTAAASLISDEVLDLFAFSGTPDRIAAQAEALYEAGARRVEFGTPHGLDEREGVELLAREVLPRLDR